jgi:hypothetical protein
MTLEELADLIRANSANTNGRIDRVVEHVRDRGSHVGRSIDHVRDLHNHIDRAQNETNATLMTIRNDFTDVRGDIKELRRDMAETKRDTAEVKRSLDLATVVADMRRETDALTAEVAELKRRAS